MSATQNIETINKLYSSFASADAEGMVSCYHEEAVFRDPAFGELQREEVKNMWRMLLERSKGELQIQYGNVKADEHSGSANWQADYTFGKTRRKVHNEVEASFEFKDGLIFRHTDRFNIWKWSRQALGLPGLLLGWTHFMQKGIQKQTRGLLNHYMSKNKEEQ